MSARGGAAASVGGAEREQLRAHGARLVGLVLSDRVRVIAPCPAAPCWRAQDGTRHSYGTLRCGLDPDDAEMLAEAHLDAIGAIARAALAACERGDQAETARLAMAAGRLCQEIAGHWPPSAVEIQRR